MTRSDDPSREATGFEWDENKRHANIEKHKIDFLDALEIFADPGRRTVASTLASHERRFVSVGRIKGRLIAVIWTERNGRIRIISARAARESYGQDH